MGQLDDMKKGCKVCILTSGHDAFDTRVFHREAKSLAAAGFDVTLVCSHNRDEQVDGVKILGVPMPRSRLDRVCLTSTRVLGRGLRQEADVYHFHDPELIVAGLLLKLWGKKVIYDVHENLPKILRGRTYLPPFLRPLISVTAGIFELLASRSFDAIVAASDGFQQRFAGHARAVAVRNFPAASGAVRRQRPRGPEQDFRLVYAGVIGESRGVVEVIRALEYLPNPESVSLVLCGQIAPPEFESELKLLRQFGRVRCLGYLDYGSLVETIAEADVGMVCDAPLPNSLDSMPNKLFHYMGCGIPVVASNFPLWRRIVETHECGIIVDPLDPRDIARAIEFMQKNPEQRKKMGENGRRAVQELYNWEAESGRLLGVYRELAAAIR